MASNTAPQPVKVKVQEQNADADPLASEIILPAVVVNDDEGNVLGTVSLTMEKVTRSVLKDGVREKVPTGATRLKANFTPASRSEARWSARWADIKATVEALAPHFD